MQIAKEPLLYHLRAAGGGTGGPSRVGERKGRERHTLTGTQRNQARVPTAKFRPNPEDLFPCCTSQSLVWLMAIIYCHFCLKALGTLRQQKNTMDPSQHRGG